jgi:hypothetical protein
MFDEYQISKKLCYEKSYEKITLEKFFCIYSPQILGAKTLSITTFSITTLSTKGLLVTLTIMTLSITNLYHYTECRDLFIDMLSVVIRCSTLSLQHYTRRKRLPVTNTLVYYSATRVFIMFAFS